MCVCVLLSYSLRCLRTDCAQNTKRQTFARVQIILLVQSVFISKHSHNHKHSLSLCFGSSVMCLCVMCIMYAMWLVLTLIFIVASSVTTDSSLVCKIYSYIKQQQKKSLQRHTKTASTSIV